MKLSTMSLAVALFAAPALMMAPAPATRSATIQQRKVVQQHRIAQDVRSGQLTRRETAHLERQERGINREERAMRAQNNGRLTAMDRRTIRHQQNRESRRIYRDKHNGRHAG